MGESLVATAVCGAAVRVSNDHTRSLLGMGESLFATAVREAAVGVP
jgi:hypothetical protein